MAAGRAAPPRPAGPTMEIDGGGIPSPNVDADAGILGAGIHGNVTARYNALDAHALSQTQPLYASTFSTGCVRGGRRPREKSRKIKDFIGARVETSSVRPSVGVRLLFILIHTKICYIHSTTL